MTWRIVISYSNQLHGASGVGFSRGSNNSTIKMIMCNEKSVTTKTRTASEGQLPTVSTSLSINRIRLSSNCTFIGTRASLSATSCCKQYCEARFTCLFLHFLEGKREEMWGFGGRYYWGRKGKKREGIVVIFAWMSSQERHVKSYVQLYSSLGWDSLICHSQFLNLFFPEKAEALASDILRELLEELKLRPCPVVFASFSGGPKACMYKVLQIIEAKCVVTLNLDDCKLVRDCLAGFIFDSSPVDFISDLGRRFAVHPSVTGVSNPPRIFSWIANGISNSLDAMFLSKFESQRAEYWQTLYSSVSMRAPYLILCSDNDELASYQVICNFTQRLRELGGDVKLVTMNGSPHVGHYRLYPIDYQAAVTGLLGKAAAVYSQRIQLLEGEKMGLEGSHDEKSKIGNLKKAICSPDRSIRGATTSSTALYMPSSLEYYEGRDVGSVQDQQKEDLIHLSKLPSINAHGVLGQILFDVCVPRDVEGWDISSSASFNAPPHTFSRRHTPFNPIRCIRRSRL